MSSTHGVLSHGSDGHLYHRKQITLCQAVCWDFFENTKKFNCFIVQDSRIVFCFVGFFFFFALTFFFSKCSKYDVVRPQELKFSVVASYSLLHQRAPWSAYT